MTPPLITTKEAALERVAFLERRSQETVRETASLGYVELTRAEQKLYTWRREINTLKKIWQL